MSHYSGRRCRPCSCCISCCNLFFCCLTLQSSKNNIAPHGSRCAGTSFSLGVFRGFSAVCPISHFNAPVRRFNVWHYPYTAAAPLALFPLFVALWRGVVPCSVAYRLRCQFAAVLVPLWLCRWPPAAPAGRSRWSPAAASPCVTLRQSRESRWQSRSPLCESRWQSRCESRKRLRQSRSFPPPPKS